MAKIREFSNELCNSVGVLCRAGHSAKEIANLLSISRASAYRLVKQFKDTGTIVKKKRTGRPRVTSRTTDNMISRLIKRDPCESSSFIQAQLPQEHQVPSTRTIRRRLHTELKLPSRRPAKKPSLSSKNIKDRIAFCRRYAHWTDEDWQKVIFSDEAMILQFNCYKTTIRRPVNQRYSPRYTIPVVKNPPKVMVWGDISCHGRAGLHILTPGETVNAQKYLDILKEKLPFFSNFHGCTMFQQDGAPCHMAKVVKNWLRDQNIQLLEPWPGSSPDLNPIENCWTMVKKAVSAKKPSSMLALQEAIKQAWIQEVTPDYCRRLFCSMPRRVAQVLKNKGLHTKY